MPQSNARKYLKNQTSSTTSRAIRTNPQTAAPPGKKDASRSFLQLSGQPTIPHRETICPLNRSKNKTCSFSLRKLRAALRSGGHMWGQMESLPTWRVGTPKGRA